MYFPIQPFIPASVPSMQGMLLSMAEYVSGTITTSSANNQEYILQAIQQTLMNALHIIDAYQIQSLMQQEYSLLINIIPILPNLSISDQNLINARIASFNLLTETIYATPTGSPYPISFSLDLNQLNNGLPALPNIDLTSYFVTFNYEVPPVGLLSNYIINSVGLDFGGTFITLTTPLTEIPANGTLVVDITTTANTLFISNNSTTSKLYLENVANFSVGSTIHIFDFTVYSDAMVNAWLDALNYLSTSGTLQQLSAYGPTERMYYCSLDTSNFISNVTFAPNLTSTADLTQLWNSLVALPTLLRVSSLLYNDPSSQLSQSINCIKYTIINLIIETNIVLASFTAPNNLQQPLTGILKVNESLMDFAARTTGNFSNWEAIATANNLTPPYVGIVSVPGIAIPGQKLFLPPFTINSPIANYNDAFLGTDINIGPPYSELLVWTGDFSLITGVDNYSEALARRVLTPVGSLIYHTSYGSLLPAQIGGISTFNEAILLSSYLKSALLSDTRTQTVNQITAYPVKFGQIVMTASVTPYGSASQVPFNLVIIPQGGGSARLA
jgi:hypothetical protein